MESSEGALVTKGGRIEGQQGHQELIFRSLCPSIFNSISAAADVFNFRFIVVEVSRLKPQNQKVPGAQFRWLA